MIGKDRFQAVLFLYSDFASALLISRFQRS